MIDKCEGHLCPPHFLKIHKYLERGNKMALIPPYVHIVETAAYVAGTSLTLTVTNSANVGNGDIFIFRCPVTVRDNITSATVPVFINVNGVATIPLKNKFGQQIWSDKVPKRAFGYYISDSEAAEPAPYVILVTTP